MHELSIAQSIVEAVEEQAIKSQATKVKSVRLQIGDAVGIVTDSLSFCFEMLTSLEPTLAGAQLLIDFVPHRAHCSNCNQEFSVVNFVVQCPLCLKWDSQVVSGTEFKLLEMEFET